MRTRALALGSTLAFLMLSGPAAWADTDSEYEREGAYVGLGGVGALANTSGRFSSLDSTGGIDLIAGYRVAHNLAWGKYLYVDDLVTDESRRSSNFGGRLMEWLVQTARDEGCDELHLDSGVQRFAAHRFYLRHGMDIASHHFRIEP